MLRRITTAALALILAATAGATCDAAPRSPRAATSITATTIMAIGDSITQGQETGGYRRFLADYLQRIQGRNVDFVGSLSTGTFTDNQHEGHPGERIDQLWTDVVPTIADVAPDVVIVQLGTNDVIQSLALPTAPQREVALIRDICTQVPSVQVVVQAPPYITGPARNQNRINFTSALGTQLRTLPTTCPWRLVGQALGPADLTADGVHPTVDGYHTMAGNMAGAVLAAVDAP